MDFTSILVITEVIFEFYWEKFFVKEISFELSGASKFTGQG
jgi:hypothetical protein